MASEVHSVSFLSHLATLEFVKSARPFIIIPRDASGKPGPQYPPGHPPHVVSAIHICRAIMNTPRGRESFKIIAVRYSVIHPNSWFLQGPSPMTMDQVANGFIDMILAEFPTEIVDYALKSPDSRGFHTRRPWDGNFKPAHQTISISGMLADRMTAAYEKAVDEDSIHRFRAFLFMTADTLLHEMAHVFITYLSKGQSLTPRHVNTLPTTEEETEGEAGRALEVLMFGGTINYFHEPMTGTPDDQCGTAYVKKASGGYYRILRKTIDDTVSFEFKFPFEHEKSAECEKLRLLGEGLEPDIRTDPLERSELAYLLKS